jgi:hypothetical protein
MLKQVFAATLACALSSFITLASADATPGTAPVPTIKIGDSWTYRYTDNWKGQPGELSVQEVVSVSDKEILLDVKRVADSKVYRRLRWSEQLNPISRGNMQFSPWYPRYAFPLETGKTWTQEVAGKNPANGKSWRYEFKVKVAGWEKVAVAAGEFDALRIDVESYYQGQEVYGNNGSGRSIETVWYAPAVKSYVKLDYQDTDWRGKVFNRDSLELTAFSVK